MASASIVYDALILGSGPAGLAAALALSRLHRTAAIFTKPNKAGFRNEGVHAMHNVVSRDGESPAEFRRIATEQLKQYNTASFIETDIVKLSKKKVGENNSLDGFEVQDATGRTWVGRKLALTMGISDIFPEIEGFKENWPHNIFPCLFCDGHERSHLPGGVLRFDSPIHSHIAEMANLLRTPTSGPVTIFTDGPPSESEAIKKGLTRVEDIGCRIETRRVKRLIPLQAPEEGVKVVLEDGEEYNMGFLTFKPDTVIKGRDMLVELGVELQNNPIMGEMIKVNEFGATNIPGVFAAGDAAVMMKAVTTSLNSGMMVGGAIIRQLLEESSSHL